MKPRQKLTVYYENTKTGNLILASQKHIVFFTFGSLGDLFPYIAVGKAIVARYGDKFKVTIATTPNHQSSIESHGLTFAHTRPDFDDLGGDEDALVKKVMDARVGPDYVLKEILFKHIGLSYETSLPIAATADIVITHPLTLAAIVAARKLDVPRVASVLAPTSLWSAYDLPSLPKAKWAPNVKRYLGMGGARWFLNMMNKTLYPWTESYRDLQRRVGLPVDTANPIFEGQYSDKKNLALFSPLFAKPQPDWPPNTVATGFPFLDQEKEFEPDDDLKTFLAHGSAPVVFTLGSSAVKDAGTFYEDSIKMLKETGHRGVMLIGSSPENQPSNPLPKNIIAAQYLPHSYIFTRAAAIVHQGGAGTTGQALRSGKPQLVMPFSHDQFDNARRVTVLGAGLTIDKSKYREKGAVQLSRLLTSGFEKTAEAVGEVIRNESGAQRAADEIVNMIS